MFSSSHQTGSKGVEILSPTGTDPLKAFDISGNASREYV